MCARDASRRHSLATRLPENSMPRCFVNARLPVAERAMASTPAQAAMPRRARRGAARYAGMVQPPSGGVRCGSSWSTTSTSCGARCGGWGAPGDVDDATQRVFLIANQKISKIQPGRERSFLVGVAARVASHARRAYHRREQGEQRWGATPESPIGSGRAHAEARSARFARPRARCNARGPASGSCGSSWRSGRPIKSPVA